jgi:hypothetical protein
MSTIIIVNDPWAIAWSPELVRPIHSIPLIEYFYIVLGHYCSPVQL